MAELLTLCPVCKGNLSVSVLNCDSCGLSLQNQFHLNPFNYLSSEEMTFLLTFLKHEGSLKSLQEELNISYPFAKKKLQLLLQTLQIASPQSATQPKEEEIDMSNILFRSNSNLASDIIKEKISKNQGKAIVTSALGKTYEIFAKNDGIHFTCDQLPLSPPYDYSVFDHMVECLIKNGNTARKGNGRNFKLGDPDCDDTTLVGYIGKHYAGKDHGASIFDPIFVLVPVLEWAGIAHNKRGFVTLTASFQDRIKA